MPMVPGGSRVIYFVAAGSCTCCLSSPGLRPSVHKTMKNVKHIINTKWDAGAFVETKSNIAAGFLFDITVSRTEVNGRVDRREKRGSRGKPVYRAVSFDFMLTHRRPTQCSGFDKAHELRTKHKHSNTLQGSRLPNIRKLQSNSTFTPLPRDFCKLLRQQRNSGNPKSLSGHHQCCCADGDPPQEKTYRITNYNRI